MAYPDVNEMRASTPDAVRSEQVHMGTGGDTFMRMWWAMQMIPLGTRVDRDDWALIRGECEAAADDRYLSRLATF